MLYIHKLFNVLLQPIRSALSFDASNHLTFLATDLSSALFKRVVLGHLEAVQTGVCVFGRSCCHTGAASGVAGFYQLLQLRMACHAFSFSS